MAPTKVKRATIDWEAVRKQLLTNEQALAEASTDNPARIASAYRKRAARLAVAPAQLEPRLAVVSALIFKLREESYAIELSQLAEVLPCLGWTSVPNAPAAFLGVINVRGEIRPVIDLARVLSHMEGANDASGFVLTLRQGGPEIGLKVDYVEGVREISAGTISPPQPGKYTRSIAGETSLLLDVEKLLAEILSKQELLTA